MIEIFGTAATVLAVTGVILNNHLNRGCFYLWIVSNSIFAVLHYQVGLFSGVVRDVLFLGLAVHGLWNWSRRREADK